MPHKLSGVFEQYAGLSRSTGSGLDSSKFRKICKDCRLFDSNFKEADADLIFTKVKSASRKLDFDGFKVAINMCAEKKGVDSRALVEHIYQTTLNGPTLTGTVATANRFHDDVRTYTGVHKAGGPTTIDSDKQGLNNLLDRSSADVRGIKKDMKEAHGRNYRYGAGDSANRRMESHSSIKIRQNSGGVPPQVPPRAPDTYLNPNPIQNSNRPHSQMHTQYYGASQSSSYHEGGHGDPGIPEQGTHGHQHYTMEQNLLVGSAFPQPPTPPFEREQLQQQPAPIKDPETELYNVYLKYCANQEAAEMDSSKFVKFCKDSGIIDDRTFKLADADLLFQRSKKAGNYGKKITYEEFRTVAFPAIALKKDVSQADLAEIVIRLGQRGPSILGTVPVHNRFHDDRSTYTGVHVAGGPSTKNDTGVITIESLLDRSDADIRGVKQPDGDEHHRSTVVGGWNPEFQPGTDNNSARRYGKSEHFLHQQDAGSLYRGHVSGERSDPYSFSPQTEGTSGYDSYQTNYSVVPNSQEFAEEYTGVRRLSTHRSHPQTTYNGAPAPTLAGQANKKGGIYDRLSNPTSFTGVYAERFKGGDGRINGDTVNQKSNFRGNTNARTDEHIHDLTQIVTRR